MIEYKTISLANQVYEQLEKKILDGTYKIGEIISEKRLSEELGVSRTPIREAMSRLTEADLIKDSPSGTVVMGITPKDIRDAYEVKLRLEGTAVRWAAENMTDEQLRELQDIVDQQEFYAKKEDFDKVRDLDTDFHDLIYGNCGSTVLRRVLSPIHHKLFKYRKQSLQLESRLDNSIEEHQAICQALKERDPDKAEKLIMHHIRSSRSQVEKVLGGE